MAIGHQIRDKKETSLIIFSKSGKTLIMPSTPDVANSFGHLSSSYYQTCIQHLTQLVGEDCIFQSWLQQGHMLLPHALLQPCHSPVKWQSLLPLPLGLGVLGTWFKQQNVAEVMLPDFQAGSHRAKQFLPCQLGVWHRGPSFH